MPSFPRRSSRSCILFSFSIPGRNDSSESRGESSINVIPNPLVDGFGEKLIGISPKLTLPVVAWIGRLDEFKNWMESIDIAGYLRKRTNNIEFMIVCRSGGEEISQELYKRARRAGICDRMRWYWGIPYVYKPTFLEPVRDSGGVVVSTSTEILSD
jgi:hypothetical protein